MRLLFIAFLSLLLLNFSLKAQNFDYARKIVDTLASSYFEGRGYVGDGIGKSALFLSNEYKAIGLKSFKKSYYQNFAVSVNTFPGDMSLKLNDSLLTPGKDFLIDPLSASVAGKFELIYIQKSQLTEGLIVQQLAKSVAGKMLLLDERGYKAVDKESDSKILELANYLKYNNSFPSRGTIVLTDSKLSWYPATSKIEKPVFLVHSEIESPIPEVAEVRVQAKFEPKYSCSNIIAYAEGTVCPDSFLVLTAHYDHLGKMGSETYFPGANDNASGVAMLLSLSRYFKENPSRYTVVFMALAGEEIGLLGAKYFTENSLFDLSKTKFLVNFDLAGTGDEGIKVVNGTVYKREFNLLTELNQQKNYLPAVQPRGEACISDHCMFYMHGVPCFYIYTLGGISAYHDIYDRPETLPLTAFDSYFKLITSFFEAL